MFVGPATFALPLGKPLAQEHNGVVLEVDEQRVIKLVPLDVRLQGAWSATTKEFRHEIAVLSRLNQKGVDPFLSTQGTVDCLQRGAGPQPVTVGYLVLEKTGPRAIGSCNPPQETTPEPDPLLLCLPTRSF